ncbi:MAG: glycoside hydrolase family 19 protein [Calditrichaeota bacterium]|nr:glycoside hydrolase family 19 protein [Calditrichota bacterium]
MLDPETLARFAPRCRRVAVFARVLEQARRHSDVTTARRLAAFMGQVYVETAGLTRLEENLRYSTPERLDQVFSAVHGVADAAELIAAGPQAIANRIYAGRLGNGDEASGDGWAFRGSGFLQVTGRDNFRALGTVLGIDLEADPDQAREPATAARLAFAFWTSTGCNRWADSWRIERITRLVNGPGMHAKAQRLEHSDRAATIWT